MRWEERERARRLQQLAQAAEQKRAAAERLRFPATPPAVDPDRVTVRQPGQVFVRPAGEPGAPWVLVGTVAEGEPIVAVPGVEIGVLNGSEMLIEWPQARRFYPRVGPGGQGPGHWEARPLQGIEQLFGPAHGAHQPAGHMPEPRFTDAPMRAAQAMADERLRESYNEMRENIGGGFATIQAARRNMFAFNIDPDLTERFGMTPRGGEIIDEHTGLIGPANPAHETASWWYRNHLSPDDERAAWFANPEGYELTGPPPDPDTSIDVLRVSEAAQKMLWIRTFHPGLVLMLDPGGPADKWFVSFNPPDAEHPEMWFHEASGNGYVYGPHELTEFVQKILQGKQKGQH